MLNIISVVNVTKTYRFTGKERKNVLLSKKKVALSNFSFSVNKGEIFGLLGPNGAGKTTAMRIISTLIKSDSGDVFVTGINATKYPLQVRKKIGFLSADLKLEEFFTPTYLFDFFSAIRGIPKSLARENREILFGRFGIKDYAKERLSVLSNGMKQKVALVVSIAHDPSIVIFDEPTNGLDILTVKEVTDFILDLKEQKKTIILATHIFNFAEKVCDRVGFIVDGHMLHSKTLSRLTGEENLEDTFFSLYNQNQSSSTFRNLYE